MVTTEQKRKYRETYRNKNKDIINEKKKEKFVCECGSTYTKCHESRHKETSKHLKFIHDNEEVIIEPPIDTDIF
jgi:hypothetical protein